MASGQTLMPYKDREQRLAAGRAADLRWRTKFPERKKLAAQNTRRRKIEVLNKIKDVPCKDCGVKYPPPVMEFDHINRDKEFTISRRVSSTSVERLLAEVAKCEVVCANCHRMRTFRRALS
jgi:hypothetical protein